MRTALTKVRVLVPARACAGNEADGAPGLAPGERRGHVQARYEPSDVGDDFVPRERRRPKRVIEDWAEVPNLMPLGSKWQVVVPPVPLFGESGTHTGSAPTISMYFEIELVAIR